MGEHSRQQRQPKGTTELPTPPLDLGVIDLREFIEDFPGALVAKNQPSDAEDVGLIPGQGTKGTCPTREACALQQKISHAANQFSKTNTIM